MAPILASLWLLAAGRCGALPTSESLVKRAPTVELIFQLPPIMPPENESLRYNGQLLVTCLTCNTLSQLDPNLGPRWTRCTIYQYPEGVINVSGIDRLSPDRHFRCRCGPSQHHRPDSIGKPRLDTTERIDWHVGDRSPRGPGAHVR